MTIHKMLVFNILYLVVLLMFRRQLRELMGQKEPINIEVSGEVWTMCCAVKPLFLCSEVVR